MGMNIDEIDELLGNTVKKVDARAEINKKIKSVPVISESAYKLLQILDKKDFSYKEIATIVESDSVLSGKVLKTVNSSAFSLSRKIVSVHDALPLIGNRALTAITMESAAPDVFKNELGGYRAQSGELWEHSLKTAIAARFLSVYLKEPVDGGLAYTAGLVHDIGKSLLSTYLEKQYENIVKKMNEQNSADNLELEKDFFGIDHAEAGEILVKHWQLPQIFEVIARYHHTPSEASEDERSICFLVHIADIISMMAGSGTGIDSLHYRLDNSFINYFNMTEEQFQKTILDVNEEFIETKKVLDSTN